MLIAANISIARSKRTGFVRAFFITSQRIALWPVRVARARKTMNLLAAMDEHQLRDIGLTSHDIASAQALPLDQDPSAALHARVRERARSVPKIYD